jgi:hypothetical protein
MSPDTKLLIIGIGFLGLLGISIGVYVAWNSAKKGKMRLAAEEDAKLLESGLIKESEFSQKIREAVPSLITTSALLAGITVAAVFIIIGQITFNRAEFLEMEFMQRGILVAALFLATVSAICWLINLEQFTQMLSPSVNYDKLGKFQRYTYTLWRIGLTLTLISIYLFLLLANPYVAMAAGFATLWILIGYWKIHCGW